MFENRTTPVDASADISKSILSKADAIAGEIRSWWAQECSDWDAAVTGAALPLLPSAADLWDDMPVVDSKAVARTSPIFERHLGVPLDVKLIRPGGYASIDDVIVDLVSKMETAAQAQGNKRKRG